MSVIVSRDQCPSVGAIYAKNTVPEILVAATETVSVALKYWPFGDSPDWGDADVVFEGSYSPDFNGEIHLDFNCMYDSVLSTQIPTDEMELIQPKSIGQFKVFFRGSDSGDISTNIWWLVIDARLESSDSFKNWSDSHFLTNQPIEKHTTESAKEWISYYDDSGACRLVARFYRKDGGYKDIVVKEDDDRNVYAVNVSYSRLVRMTNIPPAMLSGFYDVMLFDTKNTLHATQRYIFLNRTGTEKYFLFVNALGGIDTLTCDGENVLQPSIVYNMGRFNKQYVQLDDTDDVREWKQTTGMMETDTRNWLYELVACKRGAMQYDDKLDEFYVIVLTSVDMGVSDFGQLGSLAFTYTRQLVAKTLEDRENGLRTLSAAEAEAAEELFDETEKQSVVIDSETGKTEPITIQSNTVYVDFHAPSGSENTPIYYYIDGSDEPAGYFTPGTDESPVAISVEEGQSISFGSDDETTLNTIEVYYYDSSETPAPQPSPTWDWAYFSGETLYIDTNGAEFQEDGLVITINND